MKATPEVIVTLTDELWSRLREEAVRLGVPVEWLIAGLICDTIDARPATSPAA